MQKTDIARPHYITLDDIQVRVWHRGLSAQRPDTAVVAFAGLTKSAEGLAAILGDLMPDAGIVVLETPGIGSLDADHRNRPAGIILADVLNRWGLRDYALIAPDMTAGYLADCLPALNHSPQRVVTLGLARARAWANAPERLADFSPRQDGSHLTAFWCHLRDYTMLTAEDLRFADPEGDPLPQPDSIHLCLAAAAVAPHAYVARWKEACAGMAALPQGVIDLGTMAELPDALADLPRADIPELPVTTSLPDGKIWNQFVETPRGRLHLRRCGISGPALLILGTGGGSSAQFAPVVQGLAAGRQVFSVDYIGNGLSEKQVRETSIEIIAQDMLALMTELGFETFAVWGSHTGSLVGLDLGVRAPDRVERLVLEGPVFIDPAFQKDLQDNYFVEFDIDGWGRHIQTIWHWRRDMFLFWPWYRDDRQAARQLGLPTAENLHFYAMGVLESGPTYGDAYASAYRYDTTTNMRALDRPTLVCAGPNDMLVNGVEASEKLGNPAITTQITPTTVWWPDPDPVKAAECLDIYDRFLSQTA